ncbi:MAG TPA: hypothetical protein VHC45_08740 [Gaiellaceae bacterium]|nr:hypothetical protein [Gaiellaceae bacterium]
MLRDELIRLAGTSATAAEITRALGDLAWREGLKRPSYARVRRLVAEERSRIRPPSWTEVATDVAFRRRSAYALVERADGTLPRLPEDAGLEAPFSSRPG